MKNPWYTIIQHCTTLIFLKKLDFCDFFLRKFLLTVFHIIYGKFYFFYCPKTKNWIFAIFFKKVSIDGFSHYLWGILFFLMSKVSNMNFYEKSLIYNYTTLYDIDFPQKIGFLRFFLRNFLLTVFNIIYGEYYFF